MSNLIDARKAVLYTLKVLGQGMSNPVFFHQQMLMCTAGAAAAVETVRQDARRMGNTTSAKAGAALCEGAGNCSEMARVAFKYLKKKGVTPLHLMHIPVINWVHLRAGVQAINRTFVLIGGQNVHALGGGVGTNCTRWGNDAVICDPWLPAACPASAAQTVWTAYGLTAAYHNGEGDTVTLAAHPAEAPF
jgi:hypothetical protein